MAAEYEGQDTKQNNCQCDKEHCKENEYIGESERPLSERICEPRGYIFRNDKRQATGDHFNQPGHSLSNMKVLVLEKGKVQIYY